MLRAFPFRTFDEIAELGLEVCIRCTCCKRRPFGPIDLTDQRLSARSFTRTRFVCSNEIKMWDASPARICGGLGQVIINPSAHRVIPPNRSMPHCLISCPRCVPPWEVSQAAKHLPPWKEIFAERDARLRCPNIGCRAILTTVWHGDDGVPFTDGYRREDRHVS